MKIALEKLNMKLIHMLLTVQRGYVLLNVKYKLLEIKVLVGQWKNTKCIPLYYFICAYTSGNCSVSVHWGGPVHANMSIHFTLTWTHCIFYVNPMCGVIEVKRTRDLPVCHRSAPLISSEWVMSVAHLCQSTGIRL